MSEPIDLSTLTLQQVNDFVAHQRCCLAQSMANNICKEEEGLVCNEFYEDYLVKSGMVDSIDGYIPVGDAVSAIAIITETVLFSTNGTIQVFVDGVAISDVVNNLNGHIGANLV